MDQPCCYNGRQTDTSELCQIESGFRRPQRFLRICRWNCCGGLTRLSHCQNRLVFCLAGKSNVGTARSHVGGRTETQTNQRHEVSSHSSHTQRSNCWQSAGAFLSRRHGAACRGRL
ncbi:hypothetical protein BLNAU_6443 [Blattamonas nauphoetae]|uniref:Uncharacterized protein n=1 Tax=Blattamonas nauphoetae TaxID=2049346 RepID=A0ABQ9Y4S2_9EUKA|nr:hypothetical protein BLNAU_6443 [Blattamonas nauphoetae]